jgi:hypothetical protein
MSAGCRQFRELASRRVEPSPRAPGCAGGGDSDTTAGILQSPGYEQRSRRFSRSWTSLGARTTGVGRNRRKYQQPLKESALFAQATALLVPCRHQVSTRLSGLIMCFAIPWQHFDCQPLSLCDRPKALSSNREMADRTKTSGCHAFPTEIPETLVDEAVVHRSQFTRLSWIEQVLPKHW